MRACVCTRGACVCAGVYVQVCMCRCVCRCAGMCRCCVWHLGAAFTRKATLSGAQWLFYTYTHTHVHTHTQSVYQLVISLAVLMVRGVSLFSTALEVIPGHPISIALQSVLLSPGHQHLPIISTVVKRLVGQIQLLLLLVQMKCELCLETSCIL